MATIGHMIFFFTCLLVKANESKETVNTQEAEDFLAKFGYLPTNQRSGSPQQRALARNRAIAKFQDYAGLPVTGQLDENTQRKMLAPRCGLSDTSRPHNRAGVTKWPKTSISWSLTKPTSQLAQDRIRSAIKQAFDVWSSVTPLNFTEVQSGSDMKFSFDIRDHGDGSAFDGPGVVLAHAFYPNSGSYTGLLHYDDEESWAFEDVEGIQQGRIDLLSVTIHELGHSLGLAHSPDQNAIMYAYYRRPDIVDGQLKQFQLSQTDITDIQGLYGPKVGTVTPAPTPSGGSSTGATCPQFQAAVTGLDGITYFFVDGNTGWKKTNAGGTQANTATTFSIDQTFPGARGISAAVMDQRDQRIFLFAGRQVFAYSRAASSEQFDLESEYPKTLQADVPFTPEGAFQYSGGHIILFSGNQFVIYDTYSNTGSFLSNVSDYFGQLPGKVSFAVAENELYFINGSTVSIYSDYQRVTSTMPLNALITC